jgi:hypothetical protein
LEEKAKNALDDFNGCFAPEGVFRCLQIQRVVIARELLR